MTGRPLGRVIPGSLETVVIEYQRVTVECCNCGHKQRVNPDGKTARCKGCGRVMVLNQAADVENVTPLRRRA